MMLRLAEKIVHQTQPTPHSCVATCVAMAVGIPVAEIGADLSRPLGFHQAAIWLAERGIWLRFGLRVGGYGETLQHGRVYLVGIHSLHNLGGEHALLLDTRGERLEGEGFNERSGWKTYDPNFGNEDKKFVDWIDEWGAVDFAELHQRNPRGVMFGEPPT